MRITYVGEIKAYWGYIGEIGDILEKLGRNWGEIGELGMYWGNSLVMHWGCTKDALEM